MALYSIADLHLPLGIDKPMDVFGVAWSNYVERLADNWQSKISAGDTVVMPGDFSWATYLEQSYKDFEFLNKLNGRKILLKGNHDYWWTTMNKLKEFISVNGFDNIFFLQNNSYKYEDIAICGTRGWLHPAWDSFKADDRKIFDREVLRLELSLNSAGDSGEIYVFTHYPPRSNKLESNEFVEMMERYPVSKCIYGHLHSAAHKNAVEVTEGGIEYKLVSSDYLQFNPVLIRE
ncbi:MAG: metallophosphoesterase [Oscillospiraceae bacterium]|nr:metallophosphoesterase [Oscillospiraceae bacterium]